MNLKKIVVAAVLAVAAGVAAESPREWNNLGARSYSEGRYVEAEGLYRRALNGWEKSDTLNRVRTMTNLAVVYRAERRYGEADSLLRQALDELSASGAAKSPEAAVALNNLAELHRVQGQARVAEQYARESVAIAASPAVADSLHTLASIEADLGKADEAVRLYDRSRKVMEAAYGPKDVRIARNRANVASVWIGAGRYASGEAAAREALAIASESTDRDDTLTALAANNLAQALRFQSRFEDAEGFYRQAIGIWENKGTPWLPDAAKALGNLGGLYHDQGREPKAVECYKRAVAMLEKSLGPNAREVAEMRIRLADVRRAQGHYSESLSIYRHTIPTLEKTFGNGDPVVQAAVSGYRRALAEAKNTTVELTTP